MVKLLPQLVNPQTAIQKLVTDSFNRLKSALSDRYAIDRELGRGGMATVYLARDLKHDRQVAVKVLHAELAATVGADRFLREIQIAAQLNHPHILMLIDSGEVEGFLYYVMPFIEGKSLRDKLARERELPVGDVVSILRDVVDALALAHSRGVIHRDIKPDNIMLLGRHALVTDFGVAKALSQVSGTSDLTTAGVALGTPAYMSPEQAVADEQVGYRSDIYAVGVLAYELLTGRPPFLGTTPQMILSAHMIDTPEPVMKYRASVAPQLDLLVMRCLEKKPADRWQSAEELLAQLDALATPSGGLTPTGTRPLAGRRSARSRGHNTKRLVYAGVVAVGLATAAVIVSRWGPSGPELSDDRVVVLPFANETGDSTFGFVSRRLANSIIERLAGVGVDQVVPYGAVRQSWEAALELRVREPAHDPVAAVVAEYGAGTVVSGSLSLQRDSLRFVPEISRRGGIELVASITPVVVASNDDGILEGLKTVSERVSAAVAWHLDPGWRDSPSVSSTTTPPPSLAVLEAYDGAFEAFERRDWEESLSEAERALALDPTYLPAKLTVAYLHMTFGNDRAADSLIQELEPFRDQLAVGDRHSLDGARAYLDGDLQAEYRNSKEQVQRYQTPNGLMHFGSAALSINHPREALEAVSGVDPDSPSLVTLGTWRRLGYNLCAALHMLGDHKRELREARKLRARHPDWAGFVIAEIRARAALGEVREVDELVHEAIRKGMVPFVSAPSIAANELRVHGHPEAALAVGEMGLAFVQARTAQAAGTASHRFELLLSLQDLERWDEAYAIAEELVREQPSSVDFLTLLGVLAARRGRIEEARGIAERLAAMEIPYDRGKSTYARASIVAVLGEKEEAVALLQQAHGEGFEYGLSFHIDPDLASLRGFPAFEEFMRPKG